MDCTHTWSPAAMDESLTEKVKEKRWLVDRSLFSLQTKEKNMKRCVYVKFDSGINTVSVYPLPPSH